MVLLKKSKPWTPTILMKLCLTILKPLTKCLTSALYWIDSQVLSIQSCCFLLFLKLTLCSPIDEAASNIILNGDSNTSQPHSSIFLTYHLIPRGRKTLRILHIAFANSGNRTQAACAASETAIHYSIASRHPYKVRFAQMNNEVAFEKSSNK